MRIGYVNITVVPNNENRALNIFYKYAQAQWYGYIQVIDVMDIVGDDAAYLKNQPGFISAQLHRGIRGSGVFVNYAVWESSIHLKKALNNIDLEVTLSDYPPSTVVSPHIFKKVSVPGICAD